MAYRLFIANKNYSSWSMRPWVMLRALNATFEEVMTPFEGAGKQQAFTRFSPTAKVPCLHDGDLVVWDSLAILEYIAEDYPAIWPTDRAARAWARSASAEMHSGFAALRDECSMNCSLTIDLGTPSESLEKDLVRLDALWQEGLERFGGPWLAGGAFTAVDAMFAPVAVTVSSSATRHKATFSVCSRIRRWPNGSHRASPSLGSTNRTKQTASGAGK